MLIIDSYKNHIFAEFDKYCKVNNIVTVSILVHSSYLLQSLDVGLYSPLKPTYNY